MISPVDVALYWVDQTSDGVSHARRVDVGDDASLTGWPPDVFEEEQSLARDIFNERWAREAQSCADA